MVIMLTIILAAWIGFSIGIVNGLHSGLFMFACVLAAVLLLGPMLDKEIGKSKAKKAT